MTVYLFFEIDVFDNKFKFVDIVYDKIQADLLHQANPNYILIEGQQK